MGYTVTSINKVPSDYGYYFILISPETFSGASEIFLTDFEKISALINRDSAIIKPLHDSDFLRSIMDLFSTYSSFDNDETYSTWTRIFDSSPGLIIMKPHPSQMIFDRSDHIFMFFTIEAINKAYSNQKELIKDFIDFSDSKNDSFIVKIIEANKNEKSGFGFLQKLKDSLLLQPNFYGIGFDIKRFLEFNEEVRVFNIKKHLVNKAPRIE